MPDDPRDLDLLTIRQLKQVAEAQPQPYRIHSQVDSVTQKDTQQGKPYLEFKLADGTESLVWRVFDGNPLFSAAMP